MVDLDLTLKIDILIFFYCNYCQLMQFKIPHQTLFLTSCQKGHDLSINAIFS